MVQSVPLIVGLWVRLFVPRHMETTFMSKLWWK